jgi:hypothetical protein
MSNSEAIAAWSAMPTDAIEAYDDQGDFPKRHLMNGNLLRMWGQSMVGKSSMQAVARAI